MLHRHHHNSVSTQPAGVARRSRIRMLEAFGCAGAVLAILTGCGSISERLSERLSEAPVVGLPANAPARPAEPAPYPAVHEGPSGRSGNLLNADDQRKVQQELIAERARQQGAAAAADAQAAADYAEPTPPQRPAGAASRSRSAGARPAN